MDFPGSSVFMAWQHPGMTGPGGPGRCLSTLGERDLKPVFERRIALSQSQEALLDCSGFPWSQACI